MTGVQSAGQLSDVACPACTYDEGEPAVGVNLCSTCGSYFYVREDGSTRVLRRSVRA